jgi:hypothetical protein
MTIMTENDNENNNSSSNHNNNNDTSYCLAALPVSLLSHLASYLSVNDFSAMAMTNRRLYLETRWYASTTLPTPYRHAFQRSTAVFQLVKEEALPLKDDMKSVLQPFQFLFQSPLYGIIQVDLALVHAPPGGYPPGTPKLCHYYPKLLASKDEWQNLHIRVNIQKKFPMENGQDQHPYDYNNNRTNHRHHHDANNTMLLTTPKIIFRYCEALPGCAFHFESKCTTKWKAGHLGYLVHVCANRASQLPTPPRPDSWQGGNGTTHDQEQDRYKPPILANDFLLKFQASLRQHAVRSALKEVQL